MISLSPRLAAAAALVIPGAACADIGTDHAYLPVYLVESGVIPSAIATDRAAASVAAATRTVAGAGLSGRVEVRAGDGLMALQPGEAATVCLCGMGGSLILEILKKGRPVLAKTQRLVLQPQRDIKKLRRYLAESGWRIVAENIVQDSGLWYQIMALEKGPMALSSAAAAYGPLLIERRDPLLKQYLEEKSREQSALIGSLAQKSGERAGQRKKILENEQKELEALLLELAEKQ